MDLIQLQKIHAIINKSKKNKLIDNFFLYTITVLTCSLFCSSPLWFPFLYSSIRLFLSVSFPKLGSMILNSKFIFILGNLIIFLLIGESKFFVSNSSSAATDLYYNEYVNRKKGLHNSSTMEEKEKKTDLTFNVSASKTCEGANAEAKVWDDRKFEVVKTESYEFEEVSLPAEELNKRADDFIAWVNRQRMQEARLLLY
ncbi:uncharacterized protein LOC126673886 [Mercurialis annua]|uniref:uncharacterized protein LOC126673886 n=1 Tax=Mercurialis annua TaxID=3986 RepID=UPI00215DFC9F|nr:uncharacterized protein LOC126673886 [Mercurialis annua]